MKNIIGLIVLVASFGISVCALAQDSATAEIDALLNFQVSPRYALPQAAVRDIDGEKLWCLDVEQRKTVMLMASEFHGLYDWRLKVYSILRAQRDILQSYELKISSYEASLKVHESDRDYLTTRLDKEEQWGIRLEKSKGYEILAWKIAAGLELLAIVAGAVVVVVKD